MRAAKTAVAPLKSSSDHQPPGPVPVPTRAELIDRFGELDRRYRLWKPDEDEYEALKAQIKSWYENFPAEKAVAEEGKLYKVILTARINKSTPNIPKLLKKFGRAAFREMIVVYKTAVEKALQAMKERADEDAVDEYFTSGRTGSRRISVVLIAPVKSA